MGDYSYGDGIWCVQVEEIGVEGGCDSIVVKKITVRQPDHSGQQQWKGSRCYSSLLSELAGGSLPAFQIIPVPCISKASTMGYQIKEGLSIYNSTLSVLN